jgi:hypothetical protein
MPQWVSKLLIGFIALTVTMTLMFMFVPDIADAVIAYVDTCRDLGRNITTEGDQPGIA